MDAPQRCTRGHWLLPGHMIVYNIPCSCGEHITWECECSAVTYGPALAEGCSLLDGPARLRVGRSGPSSAWLASGGR